jgi:hypothetical protein
MRHRKASHVRHLFAFGAVLAAVPAAAQLTDWHRCIVEKVARLEDHRSDARSVAAAVVQSCRQVRINELKPKIPRDLVDDEVEARLARLVDGGREQDIDYVTATVLEARARRRR